MKICLFASKVCPRLRYIADLCLRQWLGADLLVTDEEAVCAPFDGLKIAYVTQKPILLSQALHIPSHGLLSQKGIFRQDIPVGDFENVPVLFNLKNSGADLPFDIFSACFYLLSRYEEYLPFEADRHGRFAAHQSLAAQHGFLELPVVQLWIKLLANLIKKAIPTWKAPATSYRRLQTFDIDLPWAYNYRRLRHWLGLGKDVLLGKTTVLQQRWRVWRGLEQDPYFTFPLLERFAQATPASMRIFWLMGQASRHDTNPPVTLAAYRQLIRDTVGWSQAGIHPSYGAFGRVDAVSNEKEVLEDILGNAVTHSRQHFLRLRFPETYRQLLSVGILHDHSMGFAEQVGYRAGSSEPFPWYDLDAEQATDLWIHPFVAMDVTLRQYMKLSAGEAAEVLAKHQRICEQHGLSFTTLWHNSSFSPLHGWPLAWMAVYEGTL